MLKVITAKIAIVFVKIDNRNESIVNNERKRNVGKNKGYSQFPFLGKMRPIVSVHSPPLEETRFCANDTRFLKKTVTCQSIGKPETDSVNEEAFFLMGCHGLKVGLVKLT